MTADSKPDLIAFDEFMQWAFEEAHECARTNCPYGLNGQGPSFRNDACQQCYKDSKR